MADVLYFVRHGETDWNAERRMQGQWESSLTERGHAQAETNAVLLARLGIDRIYASPLRRTRDTAEKIAARAGCPVTYHDRLKEWHAGDWSGFLYQEIMARWPDEWAAWRDDMWNYRPPGCENFVDLERRGGSLVSELLAGAAGRVAIVSHGFIGRAMLKGLLGLTEADALTLRQGNDMIYALTREEGGWRAERYVAGEGPFAGLSEGQDAPKTA